MNMRLTVENSVLIVTAVTHRPETDRFLRAAVKSGLRLQQAEVNESKPGQVSTVLRTLQRIKASLQKQNLKAK